MNLIDRARLEYAVMRYDFWLELRGARGRDRKALRKELRDNLRAASADVGVTRALFGIGSSKQLAYAVTPPVNIRPRWSMGAVWATLTFGGTLLALVWTAVTFVQVVDASGTTDRQVSSPIFPWFGTTFYAEIGENGNGLSFGLDNPLALLLLPLLVFVLVARPWRMLHRSRN